MKNPYLVMPRYRVVKECRDENGRVSWEKRWYFRESDAYAALMVFDRAITFWLPDSERAKVALYDGDTVIFQYGYGIAYGMCGFFSCGSDCSICPIGGGI